MTTITTDTTASSPVLSRLRGMLDAIGTAYVAYAEARSRSAEFERLTRMSDAELAALGIDRDGIARHVFRDLFYV